MAHVVDFLCAVNTPGLRINLEYLKSFFCKAIPWKSPAALPVLAPQTLILSDLASVIGEMHCNGLQKQLEFREVLLS